MLQRSAARIGIVIGSIAVVWMAAASVGVMADPSHATQFRAGVDLVTLDVLVVANDGTPIPDLRAEEVTIRVNGRARPVRSVQFVDLREAPTGEPMPAPFGTNDVARDGRAVLILLDDESIGPGDERRMREEADSLIGALAPRDRVALFVVPHGGARIDFTTDHSRVRQALAQVVGRAPRETALMDRSCQSRQTLEAIQGTVASLRRGNGLPVVVILSAGLMGPRRELELIGTTRAPAACDVRMEDFQNVARAALTSRAHFFVGRAERQALPTAPVEDAAGRSTNLLVGLEQLAGATRAPLINLVGSNGQALTRVVRESSGYYLVGFEPDASDRTGQPRSLDIRVARDGASVRALPEITLDDAARVVRATSPTPEDLLKVSAVSRDLPMRVTAYTSREAPGGSLRIAVVGEAAEGAAALAAAAIGLVDSQSRLVGQFSAAAGDLTGPVMAAFAAPPGAYRVRVAAIDTLGRTGTADYELTAELTPAGPLQLGALILGVSREAGFAPRLQFRREAVATVLLEIYGAKGGTQVDATFELAATANGPATLSQPATFSATAEDDKFIATAAFPIGSLPPGDYIVRAVIGIPGQPAARVIRVLRKAAQ